VALAGRLADWSIRRMRVGFQTKHLETRTEGLASGGQPELAVTVKQAALIPESEAFLRYVVDYVERTKAVLRSGETLLYGYWVVRFMQQGDALEVWEYDKECKELVPGANLALTYWRDQRDTCLKLGAPFVPPRADRLAAISAGVFEGDEVEGVRYPSPEHMSGWWITTDRYDGNVDSIKNEHLYHVTAARPELAKYLALPQGFRFHLKGEEAAWFDAEVASEKPV